MAVWPKEWQQFTSPNPVASRPLLIAATSQLALGGASLAAAALALGSLGAVRGCGFAVALASYGLVAARVLLGLGRHAPHRRFGLANAITLTRAAATALLLGVIGERLLGVPPALDGALRWLLAGVAVTALALDGVDGWAARRHGMESDFGARFDMDIDALFLLALALLGHATGQVGPWVMAIGLMHYAFVLAGRLWPPLAAPLKPRRRRQLIGVMQGAALIAVVTPVTPTGVAPLLCLGALGLLLYSFGADSVYLAAQADRPRPDRPLASVASRGQARERASRSGAIGSRRDQHGFPLPSAPVRSFSSRRRLRRSAPPCSRIG